MSMKLTPSSTARRSTACASSRSGGSPQIPRPVIRIAPNPRRLTVRSPPMSIVPASAAVAPLVAGHWGSFHRPGAQPASNRCQRENPPRRKSLWVLPGALILAACNATARHRPPQASSLRITNSACHKNVLFLDDDESRIHPIGTRVHTGSRPSGEPVYSGDQCGLRGWDGRGAPRDGRAPLHFADLARAGRSTTPNPRRPIPTNKLDQPVDRLVPEVLGSGLIASTVR